MDRAQTIAIRLNFSRIILNRGFIIRKPDDRVEGSQPKLIWWKGPLPNYHVSLCFAISRAKAAKTKKKDILAISKVFLDSVRCIRNTMLFALDIYGGRYYLFQRVLAVTWNNLSRSASTIYLICFVACTRLLWVLYQQIWIYYRKHLIQLVR